MKFKFRFPHSYSIIFFLVVAIASCQEKNCSADLLGKWTLVSHSADKDKIIQKLKPEVSPEVLQDMVASGSLEESAKSLVEAHAAIEFTQDGKRKDAHQNSNDYSLSTDCKQLFLSTSPRGKDQYVIIKLNSQVLELEYFGVELKFKKNG